MEILLRVKCKTSKELNWTFLYSEAENEAFFLSEKTTHKNLKFKVLMVG